MSTISFQSGVTTNGSIIENATGSYTVGNSFAFTDLGLGAGGIVGDFHNLGAIGGNGINRGTLTASLIDDALGGGDSTGTVSWSYSVNDSQLQDLAEGQQLTETFQVTVLDSEGNTLVVPIAVTITGSNDAPVFAIGEPAPIVTLVEDSLPTLTSSGTLNFNDVDILDTHTVNVGVVASGTPVGAPSNSALLAMLSRPVTSTTGASAGSIAWAFNAASSNFDYLDAGQTLTLVYTLTLSDGHSGTDAKTITVNVQGTNDIAAISVTNLSDTEGNTASSILSGSIVNQVSIIDLDASDAAAPMKYVAGSGSVAVTANTGPPLLPAPAIAFVPATGAFSYDRADFNYLAAGQSVTYTFTFDAQSGNDAAQNKTLTLTINGQNDAPVLSVVPTPPDVTISEPPAGTTTLNQTGTFDVTDVDVSNTLTIAEGTPTIVWSKAGGVVPAAVVTALTAGTAFSINDSNPATNLATVDWTLNSTADFNFLAVGETLTITYPVSISDGAGGSITRNVVVTVTGTNDDPVATTDTGSATEGITSNVAAAQGVLANDTDADKSDVLFVTEVNGATGNVATATAGTNGGSFTIAANGGYTFTPGASFEDLGVGEPRTTSIVYKVSDGHAGTDIESLTVTVTGTNDAPLITGGGTVLGTVNDPASTGSAAVILQTGSFAFTDIDLDFNNNQIKKSLAVNFGNLLGASCALKISEVESNLSDVNSRYVFKGVSANACKGYASKNTTSTDGSVDSFQKNNKNDSQICGQCSINFEKAPLLLTLGSFNPAGFVIRLASSLIRYNNFRNDQIINPTEFNLNTDYIVDAYRKNNSLIPEHCVPMLSRGLSCRSSMCESLVVKEYEQATGLKIDKIQLVEEPDYLNSKQTRYKTAEIKNINNDRLYNIPISCDKEGNFFSMSLDKKFIQQIRSDSK